MIPLLLLQQSQQLQCGDGQSRKKGIKLELRLEFYFTQKARMKRLKNPQPMGCLFGSGLVKARDSWHGFRNVYRSSHMLQRTCCSDKFCFVTCPLFFLDPASSTLVCVLSLQHKSYACTRWWLSLQPVLLCVPLKCQFDQIFRSLCLWIFRKFMQRLLTRPSRFSTRVLEVRFFSRYFS